MYTRIIDMPLDVVCLPARYQAECVHISIFAGARGWFLLEGMEDPYTGQDIINEGTGE